MLGLVVRCRASFLFQYLSHLFPFFSLYDDREEILVPIPFLGGKPFNFATVGFTAVVVQHTCISYSAFSNSFIYQHLL